MSEIDNLLGGSSPRPSQSNSYATAEVIVTRYQDAYRVADFVIGLGTTVKVIGMILGVLIFFGLVSQRTPYSGGNLLILGLIVGAIVAGIGFVLGTLLSAHGQTLRATLDTAVYASPFLNDDEKLQAMRV